MSDAEICRRLAACVRAEQLGLEEPEWRAFCARTEQALTPAAAAGGESWTIHIDGAARGNPGPAAIGLVISDSTGLTVREEGGRLGRTTNNVAEYRALLRALEIAQELGAPSLRIRSDSELLVRQMNGLYRVKHEQLLPLYLQARELCRNFASVEFVHVPRSQNRRADQLANLALDTPENSR
ncbi:MAG TPA: ribonuclease HI family protein [bacterium]|nr:ribonuclease HI family protein [bacterium]HPR89109.1 ribonuclease HI family protein [bacterium]